MGGISQICRTSMGSQNGIGEKLIDESFSSGKIGAKRGSAPTPGSVWRLILFKGNELGAEEVVDPLHAGLARDRVAGLPPFDRACEDTKAMSGLSLTEPQGFSGLAELDWKPTMPP